MYRHYLRTLAAIGLAVLAASVHAANPQVELDTTAGKIRIELYPDAAPKTVENFLTYVQAKQYDGTQFHRVIPGFMIQGGCPNGNGTGGPGYEIPDEFHPTLKHSGPGVVSMANAGPNTGGSQFFITLAATGWLDGKHAIFGKVVGGQDVVDKIVGLPRDRSDKPKTAVTIRSATVN
jgi:cyclophilin family peptidyl-prolyl cis-trans isomerase